jgi:hypothetical protein
MRYNSLGCHSEEPCDEESAVKACNRYCDLLSLSQGDPPPLALDDIEENFIRVFEMNLRTLRAS